MNNLPLQPLAWKDLDEDPMLAPVSISESPLHHYVVLKDSEGIKVRYSKKGADFDYATGFATIDEAKAWAWRHYNEKMQPYVKPMPTWIDVNNLDGWISVKDKLPTHHQDVIVYRYDGERPSIEHSLYFDGQVMVGFGNVADEEGFFDDVYYWQPIETKALYEAMAMQLQISEVTK